MDIQVKTLFKIKHFIVKLQLSQYTTESTRQMLIYNKDKSYYYQGDVTPEILETMQPNDKSYSFQKAYFKAHLVDDPNEKGKKRIVLDEFVNPQNW